MGGDERGWRRGVPAHQRVRVAVRWQATPRSGMARRQNGTLAAASRAAAAAALAAAKSAAAPFDDATPRPAWRPS